MKDYILAIETSGNNCSIAISEKNEILLEHNIYLFNQHDKHLAEMIKRALVDIEISIDKLSAVAVSSGPGSFTGLRIGVAITKGICFDNNPKLIGVPTLDSIAFNYSQNNPDNNLDIISAIPSHRNKIYYKVFDKSANFKSEIIICEADELEINSDAILCGPAKDKLNKKIIPDFDIPNAKFISRLGYELYKNQHFENVEKFNPMYVQEFVPNSKN